MPRKTSSFKAFIEKAPAKNKDGSVCKNAGLYLSIVRVRRKTYKRCTGTRIKSAALEFNEIHLLSLIRRRRKTLATPTPNTTEPSLFSTMSAKDAQ